MLGKIIELNDRGFSSGKPCTDFDVFLEQVLGRYFCSFALSLFAFRMGIYQPSQISKKISGI